MTQIKGKTTATEQPIQRVYDRDNGWQKVRTWYGTQDAIDSLIPNLMSDKSVSSFAMGSSGAKKIVSATYTSESGSDNLAKTNAVWELFSNDLSPSIKSHPYFDPNSSANSSLSTDQKNDLRKQYSLIELDLQSGDIKASYGLDATVQAITSNYMIRAALGVTNYTLPQWVVRHTITAGKESNLKASMTNINKTHNSIPGNVGKLLDNLPTLKWVKKTPTITKRGKLYDISQEWYGLEYTDPILYPQV